MSSARDEVRDILLDLADNIRREPDLITRVGMVDEFMTVAVHAATDLRDQTCYDLMQARVSRHTDETLPLWAKHRWQYGTRWGVGRGLGMPWKNRPGRRPNEGPDRYIEIALPD